MAMDSIQLDGYASYSDSSAPRTPSPRDEAPFPPAKGPMNYQYQPAIYSADHHDDGMGMMHRPDYNWPGHHHPNGSGDALHFSHPNGSRGSLLHELYDEPNGGHHDRYLDHSAEPSFNGKGASEGYPQMSPETNSDMHLPPPRPQHSDYSHLRRATFPYVRHDRERDDMNGHMSYPPPPFLPQQQGHSHHSQSPHLPPQEVQGNGMYGGEVNLTAEPGSMNGHGPEYGSPHAGYHEYDDHMKMEPRPYYHPGPPHGYPPMGMGHHPMHHGMGMATYISPHTGLPVQHTDDAASKETQYLRRRCFNCHTTEPPSWRRSTLNPGKIVCNKCGLYERTHLRPRPLRFDELRAGNKARKTTGPGAKGSKKAQAAAAAAASHGPGGPEGDIMAKSEPKEYNLVRRSSVSSTSSSSSNSASSDWDDNGSHPVSNYSNGSAPPSSAPSSFNSPASGHFPLSRDSQSPPLSSGDAGIRLPNAPLSDIAGLGSHQGSPHMSSSPQMHHLSSQPGRHGSPQMLSSQHSPLSQSSHPPSPGGPPHHSAPQKSHTSPYPQHSAAAFPSGNYRAMNGSSHSLHSNGSVDEHQHQLHPPPPTEVHLTPSPAASS